MDVGQNGEASHRSKELTQLLHALQDADELFSYNVPAAIRTNYPNEALDSYLKRVYEQPEFIVEEPAGIEKYIRLGDRVHKVGEYKRITAQLKQNTLGTYLNPDEKDATKAIIDFDPKNQWSIYLKDLKLMQRPRFLQKPLYFDNQNGPGVSAQNELLKPKDRVKYVGEDIILYNGDIIQDKAQGIVANVTKQSDGSHLYIIWEHQPGLVQKINQYYIYNFPYIHPNVFFSCEDIKLIRKNYVNFSQLYTQHLRGNDQ